MLSDMGDFFLPTINSSSDPRVPYPHEGLQVNFCKNMECAHFGRPASSEKQPRGPGSREKENDGYTLGQRGAHRDRLICRKCGQYSAIKSNIGVHEEYARISSYLEPPKVGSCPNDECANHGVDVTAGKAYYQKGGKTAIQSQRYNCKSCGRSFSIAKKSTHRQREIYKNKQIFRALVNFQPIKRISEVANVGISTIYNRIDFFHEQCLAFVGEREREFFESTSLERLYIASDRQEYTVNWSDTKDKRNVILKAIGSADMRTGFVFGMHLNYDPLIDRLVVEQESDLMGDNGRPMPFRRHARVWLNADHAAASARGRIRKTEPIPLGGLPNDIEDRYKEALGRNEIEASDEPDPYMRLPDLGAQIHEEYTLYGHFLFLKRLFANVGKVRFFLDQDSGIRAACLSAFKDDILNARCDAFYVRINKDLTIHEKQKMVADSERELDRMRSLYPYLSDGSIRHLLILEEMGRIRKIGRWDDRWLNYPFPDMSEPEKAVCYLTNRSDYDEQHMARLYEMASLHAIDSYFNQIRTRISCLNRPKSSASNVGRRWTGYQPYSPEIVQKLLDIMRIYHNFCLKSKKDKSTPAVRLGLARAPLDLDAIIHFKP